jgi:hypothetical protein
MALAFRGGLGCAGERTKETDGPIETDGAGTVELLYLLTEAVSAALCRRYERLDRDTSAAIGAHEMSYPGSTFVRSTWPDRQPGARAREARVLRSPASRARGAGSPLASDSVHTARSPVYVAVPRRNGCKFPRERGSSRPAAGDTGRVRRSTACYGQRAAGERTAGVHALVVRRASQPIANTAPSCRLLRRRPPGLRVGCGTARVKLVVA